MNHIAVDPAVMLGKPTIKGTRITVEQILDDLAARRTADELLASYPTLYPEAIPAALAFAADAP
ncbi:MAG: DUF433 domain-containing protein [Bacteroidota bacterium]